VLESYIRVFIKKLKKDAICIDSSGQQETEEQH